MLAAPAPAVVSPPHMSTQTLPFGDGTVEAELPERARIVSRSGGAGSGGGLQAVGDLDAAVRDALEHPLGLPRIREMVKADARVVIAFDDPTVTSFGPIRRIAIEGVLSQLRDAGVPE